MSSERPLLGRMEWRRLRRMALERDGYACRQCGARGRLECDHIQPVEEGGADDLANIQVLCRDCHIAKTRAEAGTEADGAEEWARHLHASPMKRRQALLWGRD